MIQLLKLVLPIVFSYLGIMIMGVVDVWYVGKVSVEAVGAVGIGSSIFGWFLVFGLGVLSCLEYLVSHARGSGQVHTQHRLLVHGIVVSLLLSLPLTAGLILISREISFFGIHSAVLSQTQDYLSWVSLSMVFSLVFTVFRLYLTALGVTTPALLILLGANVFNALGNEILVLGRWGIPSYGSLGSAWATLMSRFLMVLILGIYVWVYEKKHRACVDFLRSSNRCGGRRWIDFSWIDFSMVRQLFQMGLPAGLQMTFEAGVFALATTLAGRLSPTDLAAHQIVLNTASLTFMVPLGIGSASAVMVGHSLGQGSHLEGVKMGWSSLRLGAGFMALCSLLFFVWGESVVRFFTHDLAVVEMGKQIFLIAGFFQIADGIQTVGTGSLRGLGDTRSSMAINLIGHWLVGLPVGGVLCFYFKKGLPGLWMGLSLGLILVALAILLQWGRKSKALLVGRVSP